LTVLIKLWAFYYAEFHWRLVVAVLLLVAGAVTEGYGLAEIITLFDNNDQVNFWSGQVSKFYSEHIFIMLFILFSFRGALLWCVSCFTSMLIIKLKEKIYNDLVRKTFRATYKSILNLGDVTISNFLIREILNISAGFKVYLQMIKSLMLCLIYFIIPTLIIPKVSIILVVFSLILLFIVIPTQIMMKKLSKRLVIANENYLKRLKSALSSIASIKAGNRSKKVQADIKNKMEMLLDIEKTQMVKIEPIVSNSIDSLVFFALLILIAVNEKFNFVSDSLFILCLGMIFKSLSMIVGAYGNLRKIATYSGSFDKFLEMKLYLEKNSEHPSFEEMTIDLNLREIRLVNVGIQVSNDLTLSNINLQLRCGDTVAFVGSSGAGKSTLLNCISTLTEFDEGDYLINNKHRSIDVMVELRSTIAYINQSYYFEEDVVKDCFDFDNITTSLVYEELASLGLVSDKYDYKVFLERNISSLSGGERQRLSIAKEICTDKTFFLLDEVTSALSEVNEKLVIQYLNRKSKDRIIITVTHSLDLAESMDQVLNIEDYKLEKLRF